jgi:hypothetical protein
MAQVTSSQNVSVNRDSIIQQTDKLECAVRDIFFVCRRQIECGDDISRSAQHEAEHACLGKFSQEISNTLALWQRLKTSNRGAQLRRDVAELEAEIETKVRMIWARSIYFIHNIFFKPQLALWTGRT